MLFLANLQGMCSDQQLCLSELIAAKEGYLRWVNSKYSIYSKPKVSVVSGNLLIIEQRVLLQDPFINSKLKSLSLVLTALAVFCRRQSYARVVWMNRRAVLPSRRIEPSLSSLFHSVLLCSKAQIHTSMDHFFHRPHFFT